LVSALAVCILAGSVAIYSQLFARLREAGGRVQTAGLELPDLLVSFVLASTFAGLVAAAILKTAEPAVATDVSQVLPGSVMFLIIVAGLIGFLRYRGLKLTALFGLTRLSIFRVVGWAAMLLVATFPLLALVNVLTLKLLGADAEPQPLVQLFRDVARNQNYSAMATIFAAGVVIAPMCEEILFRGYFYPVGKRYLGPWISGALTAILFGAFHANLASLPGLTLLAVAFTLAYERTGSLLVPIGMHALFNATSLAILYFQATGALPT
jgi:hypothetical protein